MFSNCCYFCCQIKYGFKETHLLWANGKLPPVVNCLPLGQSMVDAGLSDIGNKWKIGRQFCHFSQTITRHYMDLADEHSISIFLAQENTIHLKIFYTFGGTKNSCKWFLCFIDILGSKMKNSCWKTKCVDKVWKIYNWPPFNYYTYFWNLPWRLKRPNESESLHFSCNSHCLTFWRTWIKDN